MINIHVYVNLINHLVLSVHMLSNITYIYFVKKCKRALKRFPFCCLNSILITKISTRIFYNHSYIKYPTCTCMFNQISMGKLIPIAFPVRSKATHGEIIFYCVDKYPDLQTYSVRWGSHLYRNKLRCPRLSQVTQVCFYYITLLHM